MYFLQPTASLPPASVAWSMCSSCCLSMSKPPVDFPSFVWSKHPAERIVLPQALSILSFIQKHEPNALPLLLQYRQPLGNRGRWILAKPAGARVPCAAQTFALRIAVDFCYDGSRQFQASLIDFLMRSHDRPSHSILHYARYCVLRSTRDANGRRRIPV